MPVLDDSRVAMGLRWVCISQTNNSAEYESQNGDRITLQRERSPMLNGRPLPEYEDDLNVILDNSLNQQFINEHRVLRGARSLSRT